MDYKEWAEKEKKFSQRKKVIKSLLSSFMKNKKIIMLAFLVAISIFFLIIGLSWLSFGKVFDITIVLGGFVAIGIFVSSVMYCINPEMFERFENFMFHNSKNIPHKDINEDISMVNKNNDDDYYYNDDFYYYFNPNLPGSATYHNDRND